MSRSEICKNCCTDGGAIFQTNYGCFPHVETKEWMKEASWVKVCANCGHYKLKRKSPARLTFDEIIVQTNDTNLRNKRERAIFHAFAAAGAWSTYKTICENYAAECNLHGIKKLPFLMHWTLNTYHYEKLSSHNSLLARQVDYHIRCLKEQASHAQEMFNQDFPQSEAA